MSEQVRKALRAALFFHKRRDEMNAALHLQDVRYSPLTLLLRDAYIIADEFGNTSGEATRDMEDQ